MAPSTRSTSTSVPVPIPTPIPTSTPPTPSTASSLTPLPSSAPSQVDSDHEVNQAIDPTPILGSPDQGAMLAHQLVDALQAVPRTSNSTKVRRPDPFDGSNMHKLRTFLVQLEINFRALGIRGDEARVNFALSFLMGTALNWFELALTSPEEEMPDWAYDFQEFRQELQTHFGPYDPVANAEFKLEQLRMKENKMRE